MSGKIDDLIPSATELRKQASIKETEKAEERLRWMAAADAEKRALIEKLSKPSGLSADKKIELASTVIQRAVRNGLKEVQVYRFPNSLCTDRGRAIDQQDVALVPSVTLWLRAVALPIHRERLVVPVPCDHLRLNLATPRQLGRP
jgi:hypothetical protein